MEASKRRRKRRKKEEEDDDDEEEEEVEDTRHINVSRIENGIPGEKSERYK